MERDTTIPSSLAPAELEVKPRQRAGVHPIFLIMLALVLVLFVFTLAKRY